MYGLSRMKRVIHEAFPELAEFGFTDSRVFLNSLLQMKDSLLTLIAVLVY